MGWYKHWWADTYMSIWRKECRLALARCCINAPDVGTTFCQRRFCMSSLNRGFCIGFGGHAVSTTLTFKSPYISTQSHNGTPGATDGARSEANLLPGRCFYSKATRNSKNKILLIAKLLRRCKQYLKQLVLGTGMRLQVNQTIIQAKFNSDYLRLA